MAELRLIESDFLNTSRIRTLMLLLLFIFALQLAFIPLNTNRLVILFVIVWATLFNKDRDLRVLYSEGVSTVFLVLSLFCCYSLLMFVITGLKYGDILFNALIILFQSMLGAWLIASYSLNRYYSFNQLLFDILLICAIQGIFVLFNFLFPQFRELLDAVVPFQQSNISAEDAQNLFRVRGLTQGTGAKFSAFLAIGLLIAAYFFSVGNLSKRDRRAIVFCLPFIVIGISFTGRTGLLIIPLAFVLYYWILIAKRSFSIKSLYPLIFMPIIAFILYFVFKESYYLVTDGGVILPNGEDLFERWERWAFQQFIDYFSGKDEQFATGSALIEHIVFPQDNLTWLFGDPSTWDENRISSDIGYIRTLFSSGIVGGTLYYGTFLLTFYVIAVNIKVQSQKIFIGFFLFWLLAIEGKEAMFNHLYFSNLVMLLCFVSLKTKWRATDVRNFFESSAPDTIR